MSAATGNPSAPPAREPPAAAERQPLPRYGFLLGAAVVSVAVQGIAPPGAFQQIAVAALAGASILLALRAAAVSRHIITVAAAAAVVVLVLSVVRVTVGGIPDGAARLMNATLVAVGPPAVALGVIRDLRTTGRVRLEAVMGVLSLYMLIGMFFAFTYGAIDRLGGDPFFAN